MTGSALIDLLRAAGGSTARRIERALNVLVDELDMQVAYVSEFRDGNRVVTHSVSAPGGPSLPVGTSHPVEETLCHLIVTGDLPALVGDAAGHPVLSGHPHTRAFAVGAHAGVPLRTGGQVRGAVCCASTTAAGTLNPRDEATLGAVAGHIGELLADGADAPAGTDLRRLGAAVAAGHDLQALTRPLLQLLQDVTSLESTFLTLVDSGADELVVAYACNSGELVVPEGATTTWQDSLCCRALDEGRQCIPDVPTAWPDEQMARHLGITTYVSVAVRDPQDRLLGTLCGASATATDVDERDLAVMGTFAQLLSAHLTRESALGVEAARAATLEQRMSLLREAAERDPLTGLANRAGIERWLGAALDRLTGDEQIAVAFVDLDGFKAVNDTYGHATGDEVLRRVAASLAHTGRAGDLHGRLGGDEFVVAAVLPPAVRVGDWHARVRAAGAVRLSDEVRVVCSVGVVTHQRADPRLSVADLLHHADLAMYRDKHPHRRP